MQRESIWQRIYAKPELLFVIIAAVFGLIFTFKFAPLSGTDEFTHFPRVYQISDGTLWEKRLPGNQFGGQLPSTVNTMVNEYRNLSRVPFGLQYEQDKSQLNSLYGSITNPGQHKATAIFTSVVTYPPWAYVAPLIGLLIAKLLHTPLLWYIYLARISSLIIWILLTWLAIRLIPRGKWFMVALALLPTSLTQAATIGADGLLNGISWLLIAATLAIMTKKLRVSWPVLATLFIGMVGLGIIKDGYFFIGLFPLVIPVELFPKRAIGIGWKAATALAAMAAMLLLTIRTVRTVAGVVLVPTIGINMNSQEQIHYLLHHIPSFVIEVLWQPFTKSYDTIYFGIAGILTNRLIYLSVLLVFLLFFALYLGWYNTKPALELVPHRTRLLIAGVAVWLGTYFMLAAAFYIGNTSVGASAVNGLYGRYFLPLIPLALILPMTIRSHRPRQPHYQAAIVAISVIGLVATMKSIG